jgi:hypothetical protein
MARPTKLTEAVTDDLVVLLAAGVPVPVAARSVGVSRRTLDRWLREDELRGRVEQARAAGPVSSERGQSGWRSSSRVRRHTLAVTAEQRAWARGLISPSKNRPGPEIAA